MSTYITKEELQHLLDYDADTGVFTWKIKPCHRVKAGARAGYTAESGYRSIIVNGKAYKEHRLAWMYTNGAMPEFDIDHKNGDKSDNRFSNLRAATRGENMQNVSVGRANSTGFVGTCFISAKQRWAAYITIMRRRIHLGHFDSLEDAVKARKDAKRTHHAFQGFDRGVGV